LRRRWVGPAVVTVTTVAAVSSGVALVLLLGTDGPPDQPNPATPVSQPTPGGVVSPGPRRLPVAGSDGFYVVVMPDGSSYLESPTGQKKKLADGGPDEDDVSARVERKVTAPPKKRRGPGQLVVTDSGVVEVPQDAIITLVGRDKVVTHAPDGTSVTYYVDGRVEPFARVKNP